MVTDRISSISRKNGESCEAQLVVALLFHTQSPFVLSFAAILIPLDFTRSPIFDMLPVSPPDEHHKRLAAWVGESESTQSNYSNDLRSVIDRTLERKLSGTLFETRTMFLSPIKTGIKPSPRLKSVSSATFTFTVTQ